MDKRELLIPKLMDHVDVDSSTGCWNWKHYTSVGGQAKVNLPGRQGLLAPRIVWELNRGEIPKGVCVCHTCDNPRCVNPVHLWLGTHEDNMRDRNLKGRARGGYSRSNKARGTDNGAAKLTDNNVREVRQRYANGWTTQTALADEFGVGQTTISRIVRHKQWKHVHVRRPR